MSGGMVLAAILAAAQIAGAVAGGADSSPESADASGQIEVYDYRPDAIYPVRAALGITTRIELDPAEEVLDFSTGFSSGWDLSRRGSVFYLRPRAGDVDTNLQVRTQAHSYIFELKVVAGDWATLEQARRAGVQYKVAFRYPAGVVAGFGEAADGSAEGDSGPAAQEAGQSIALEKGRRYHFGYDVAARRAPPWMVPVSVYDDGRFTYLRMGAHPGLPTGGVPAVFARSRRDGEDFVVNTSVEDGVLVVHGTWPYLVLRHGGDVVGLRRNRP